MEMWIVLKRQQPNKRAKANESSSPRENSALGGGLQLAHKHVQRNGRYIKFRNIYSIILHNLPDAGKFSFISTFINGFVNKMHTNDIFKESSLYKCL